MKLKAQSSKLKRNPKSQTAKRKRLRAASLEIEVWSLELFWSFELWAWSFCARRLHHGQFHTKLIDNQTGPSNMPKPQFR